MNDLPTMAQLVPQIVIALVIVGAVAWSRKQDRAELADMRAKLPGAADDVEVTATGKHRAVVVPWELLGTRFDELGEKVDDEIAESRKFRESTGQRVTALETDVRWLRRGKTTHADTLDDRHKG